ncbi:MAG: hypothetical protein IJ685_11790 [Selenomonadaceae bacterium]|nr:hypothetical protein [Selenomonadaceae bacterium]
MNDFSAMLFEEMATEYAEKARLEGIEAGRLEAEMEIRNKLIKNFFANGTPIKIISKATHLTEEEVSKILADNIPKNLEV